MGELVRVAHDAHGLDPAVDDVDRARRFYEAVFGWEFEPWGPPGFYLILTDQPGKGAWPISGATFILMHKSQAKPDVAKEVLKFFDWAYKNGDKAAEELDYIPLPDPVVELVHEDWKTIKDASGNPVFAMN